MLKVCLDTNVWISGTLFRGPPAQIVEMILKKDKRLRLISSFFILKELERNLIAKFGFTTRTAKRLTYRIGQVADLYVPTGQVNAPSLSTDDSKVLETAWLGHAKYLVTGDKRVLELKRYKHIRIIEPAHLMNLV